MSYREPRYLARASDSLLSSLNTYLDRTAEQVPDTTYYSHKSLLSEFRDWYSVCPNEHKTSTTDILVQFLEFLLSESGPSATVRGHVSTLVNFFAYHCECDPEILMVHLASALRDQPDARLQRLGHHILDEDELSQSPALRSNISRFVTRLREGQFGTRTHVYLELLLDTMSRPEQVQQIDLVDLDAENGCIVVGVPETHVVGSVGLITERVAPLCTATLDALETYLKYERKEVRLNDPPPLLTTHCGRAASSTLRRSVKQTSQAIFSDSTGQAQPVLPNEVRRYAISAILTNND